jgi:predicted ATPase
MRLDYVRIDGFKNLNGVEVDFDERELTTVIIGENGSGKSNLIEALVRIFRDIDFGDRTPFGYEVRYLIGSSTAIHLEKTTGRASVSVHVNGESISLSELKRRAGELLPGMIFGYYSGSGRRLEALFDKPQQQYSKHVREKGDRGPRRFFYCHPSYSHLALLANFAFQNQKRRDFLKRHLLITSFDSALFVLRRPEWARAKPTGISLKQGDERFWYARGLVRDFLRDVWDGSLAPMYTTEVAKDNYRSKGRREDRLYLYLPDEGKLRDLANGAGSERAFFQRLESTDISDLMREVRIWVRREGAEDEIPFHEISDGERQLMTVLGLLRFAQERNALFLLDEPDTHLNPAWQLRYLDMIEEWVEESSDSHLIISTHDPLTMAALKAEQVQLMYRDDHGRVRAERARVDPRGLGFTSILTQIFGLPTTLDPETQSLLDERNSLLRLDGPTDEQQTRLHELTEQLKQFGFNLESREPEYAEFLRAWHEAERAGQTTLTPEQITKKTQVARQIIERLRSEVA